MINMNRVLNSPAFSCTAPADCDNQQINAGNFILKFLFLFEISLNNPNI